MQAPLEVRHLFKSFQKDFWSKKKIVLKDVNFKIPQGSVTGFLGANGSGKTTTFKCLFDFIKKDQGEVLFFGEPLSLKIKSKIGFLPERVRFYENLTAEECLLFLGELSGVYSQKILKERISHLLKRVDLHFAKDQKLKTFSKGMLQKIGIIQAFLSDPQFIVLDEPFSGLDADSRYHVIQLIEEMKSQGATLFFSSHILQDIERVCDRLVVLKEGSVVFEGSFLDLPFDEQAEYCILYFQEEMKKSSVVSSQEKCQKEIKRILSEGAVILSVSSQGSQLEKVYRNLAFKKKDSL